MNPYSKVLIGIVCVVMLSIAGAATVSASDSVTITGIINDDGLLVDDLGTFYEIADNDIGWQVMDHTGERVEVVGVLEEGESEIKVIVVASFKLLS